jgi:branched-chain amino acid transport system permease protein
MNYLIHLAIMIGIYLVLAYSLNLLVGFSGLLSLCHAAFYGIGAYAFTLLAMNTGTTFLVGLIFAVVLTALMAYLIGIPALKFRGDPFVLVTLGFQIIIFSILYNWTSFTKGPYGIPGIPRPVIFGHEIGELWEYLILTFVILGIIMYFLKKIYDSPYGLTLKALREDERAAESLGKPAASYLLIAFIISGAVAAISGVLYATYVTYIDPTSFTLSESIFIISILLVGGSGNIRGPFFGTLLIILLPEALRFLGMPDAVAANMRQIIYGVLLITLMFIRPQGLGGEYEVK